MQDITTEPTKKELHGTIQHHHTNIHIEEILEQMYEVWRQNALGNEEKKPYIELYFFIYIAFGYLKVLCKNLDFQHLKIEYDNIITFFRKHNIQYRKNPLLKGKEILKADKINRIVIKLFFFLDEIRLAKVSLFLYHRLTQ